MPTTITLDEGLTHDLRLVAADTGSTLTEVVQDALRESLYRRRNAVPKRVKLPVCSGQGVHPGVDITNNSSLLDIMEDLEDPD